MDVKEAIARAKAYISDVYTDEPVTNLGLEETVYDHEQDLWSITVAFSRPWNTPRSRAQELLSDVAFAPTLRRSYKVVTLRNTDGTVVAMKNRENADF